MKLTAKALTIVLMSMMSVSVATAQNTKDQSNPEIAILTAGEIVQIRENLKTATFPKLEMSLWEDCLSSNNTPQEGVVGEDGMLCNQQMLAGDSYRVYITRTERGFRLWNAGRHPVTVEDRTQVNRLDTARVETNFITKQRTGKPQYGVDYHYEASDGSSGDIHTRRQDKYGVSLVAGGDYNLGADVTSFGGRVGLAYSVSDKLGKWSLKGEWDAILRRTRFNENANQAFKPYNSYASELKGMLGYALDKHGEWRILAGPMIGWEFYETDSKEKIFEDGSRKLVESGGNFIYWGALSRLEYDWANGPIGVYVEAGYRLHKSVLQNADMQTGWVWNFSIGGNIKLSRHQSKF